jgi:hypothetical protein
MDTCNLYIQPSRYKVIDNFFFFGVVIFFHLAYSFQKNLNIFLFYILDSVIS